MHVFFPPLYHCSLIIRVKIKLVLGFLCWSRDFLYNLTLINSSTNLDDKLTQECKQLVGCFYIRSKTEISAITDPI